MPLAAAALFASPAAGAPAAEPLHASGTAWVPAASTLEAWQASAGEASLLLHGNAFGYFDVQGSERGDTARGALGWLMGAAGIPLAGGTLELRAMGSPEPWTVPDGGTPQLLQAGETFRGRPLHDRQHPHDLAMELSASYRREVAGGVALFAYGALPGEPALGPPAYVHRPSARESPAAPLSHHRHDSTHVAFGVATLGVDAGPVRLEGSAFNGREPDERRADLELAPWDSLAGRVQLALTGELVAQASVGRLVEPEALEPGDTTRATASLLWSSPLAEGQQLDAAAVYGRELAGHDEGSYGALVEATYRVGRHRLLGRAEVVERSDEELAVSVEGPFRVGAVSLGFAIDVPEVPAVTPSIGMLATVDLLPSDLAPFYGSTAPGGVLIFVRLHPPELPRDGHRGHGRAQGPAPAGEAGHGAEHDGY